MHTVLVVPPAHDLEISAPNDFEDLGLGCIAAYLRQHRQQVTIVDCQLTGLSTGDAVQRILELEPDLVGVSISFQNRETKGGVELIHSLREAGLRQPIVAGGVAATFLHEFLLRRCDALDLVCMGEGEATMLDLVGRVERGEDWHDLPGIAYRRGDRVHITAPQPLVDLKQMPLAARDTLPLQIARADARQAALGANGHGDDMLTMIRRYGSDPCAANVESSRGCPYQCSFCAVHSFYGHNAPGLRWRPRAVDAVLNEMERLEKEWGAQAISFTDDNFVGAGSRGRERALRFVDGYLARGLTVKYNFWCRADTVDEELFRRLKDTGLYHVCIGIETGAQSALDRYNKHTTVADNRRALEILTALDIPVTTSLILFDPYTTLAELGDTVEFCLSTGAIYMLGHPLGINVLVPFVGTPMRDTIVKDVELTGVAGDPSFSDGSLYWHYRCLDPDVELVRVIFHSFNSTLQQRLNFLLRLEARLRRALYRATLGLESPAADAVLERAREQGRKCRAWQEQITYLLWSSYAGVLAVARGAGPLRSTDWQSWFERAVRQYDSSHLGLEFEPFCYQVSQQVARLNASSG